MMHTFSWVYALLKLKKRSSLFIKGRCFAYVVEKHCHVNLHLKKKFSFVIFSWFTLKMKIIWNAFILKAVKPYRKLCFWKAPVTELTRSDVRASSAVGARWWCRAETGIIVLLRLHLLEEHRTKMSSLLVVFVRPSDLKTVRHHSFMWLCGQSTEAKEQERVVCTHKKKRRWVKLDSALEQFILSPQ